jgi:hypothetical protein
MNIPKPDSNTAIKICNHFFIPSETNNLYPANCKIKNQIKVVIITFSPLPGCIQYETKNEGRDKEKIKQ